jgi:hypothetical protein
MCPHQWPCAYFDQGLCHETLAEKPFWGRRVQWGRSWSPVLQPSHPGPRDGTGQRPDHDADDPWLAS